MSRALNLSAIKKLGTLFILLGLVTFFITIAVPFSKVWGKRDIDFRGLALDLTEESTRLPILPIFNGLRKNELSDTTSPFYLTINKLGIVKALITKGVAVDNGRPEYLKVLNNSLGQLKGTPLPGERGNSIVFGHSALPYLYSPNNFQTIFTKIDELGYGDTILIEKGEKVLTFKVERGGLLPEDTTVSDFSSGKPRLTLLTCYPPGFKTKKYVVTSILTETG